MCGSDYSIKDYDYHWQFTVDMKEKSVELWSSVRVPSQLNELIDHVPVPDEQICDDPLAAG